jgi:hypothetical protein
MDCVIGLHFSLPKGGTNPDPRPGPLDLQNVRNIIQNAPVYLKELLESSFWQGILPSTPQNSSAQTECAGVLIHVYLRALTT